jgi:glycosidase
MCCSTLRPGIPSATTPKSHHLLQRPSRSNRSALHEFPLAFSEELDGIGDFQGLTRRLDYLNGLGITTVWLMPFQPTPFRDDGYDVADYYGVDQRYGTIGDFVEFTHAAKQRGMRVLIDLVVNHTSNEHPWFHDARCDPNFKIPRLVCLVEEAPPRRQ